jgi:hypothetical protein
MIGRLSSVLLSTSTPKNTQNVNLNNKVNTTHSHSNPPQIRNTITSIPISFNEKQSTKIQRSKYVKSSSRNPKSVSSGKGGIVDLYQIRIANVTSPSKNKYEVRNIFRSKENRINKKDSANKVKYNKDNAARTIQRWWKNVLKTYKKACNKIIKIQSVYRGHFLRAHLFYIFYINYMLQAFINKIETKVRENVLPNVFNYLRNNYGQMFNAKIRLINIIRIQKAVKRFFNRKNQTKLSQFRKKLLSEVSKAVSLIKKYVYKTLISVIIAINKQKMMKKCYKLFNRRSMITFKIKQSYRKKT